MKLSVVTTLYHSAPYIEELYQRLSAAAREMAGDDFEIVFVNDGSPDNSLELAIKLTEQDSHIVVVDLSRNFGHHKAIMTGLAQAQGERIFLIDSDLEEAPEWLASFEQQMHEEDSDMVYGVLAKRNGGWVEKLTGWFFYRIFRLLTGTEQPDNIATARLMTRRYVQALVAHQERELNIGGLWITTGFRQSMQFVDKNWKGSTTYSLKKKFSHLVNAVTSFSSLPLIFIFYAGLMMSLSAAIFILYLAALYFFIATPPEGYLSVIASVWMFSGLIILFIGMQGIYISKIFAEVKQRPYTIVRQIYYKNYVKKEIK
ncbi:glycosyltransferase family 2 protein [Nitrosomonadales bacterium]|nr:glycosyltransferase family 2 protein [Nitrosomonadales bacterium]